MSKLLERALLLHCELVPALLNGLLDCLSAQISVVTLEAGSELCGKELNRRLWKPAIIGKPIDIVTVEVAIIMLILLVLFIFKPNLAAILISVSIRSIT